MAEAAVLVAEVLLAHDDKRWTALHYAAAYASSSLLCSALLHSCSPAGVSSLALSLSRSMWRWPCVCRGGNMAICWLCVELYTMLSVFNNHKLRCSSLEPCDPCVVHAFVDNMHRFNGKEGSAADALTAAAPPHA
jgi:hypothetical protein